MDSVNREGSWHTHTTRQPNTQVPSDGDARPSTVPHARIVQWRVLLVVAVLAALVLLLSAYHWGRKKNVLTDRP
jgi:hypothetical protein